MMEKFGKAMELFPILLFGSYGVWILSVFYRLDHAPTQFFVHSLLIGAPVLTLHFLIVNKRKK